MNEVEISLASDGEARACLALVPEAVGQPMELLIARCQGEIAGAAAILWRSSQRPAGFPVLVHVLPDQRRGGVGRRLIAAAADLVHGEAPGLWSLNPLTPESVAAHFALACGFRVEGRRRVFETSLETLEQKIRPLLDRSDAAGRGGSIEVVPLGEAPLEDVGWLLSAELGGDPVAAMHGVDARVAAWGETDGSMVAMSGSEVAGVVFCRREGPDGFVDLLVVARPWRRTTTGLRLLANAAQLAGTLGVTHLRFRAGEAAKDTAALARRLGAAELEQRLLCYYPIAST